MNRETWLEEGIKQLDATFFNANGYELPAKMQISCGFPKGIGNRKIGQCWHPQASKDETTQMFVSPSIDAPVQVLGVILHELVHACVGVEVGHKGIFRKLAHEFGLEGRMTATFVKEGSLLHGTLSQMAESLGPYPHSAMQRTSGTGGKKTNIWERYVSKSDPTYKIVISPRSVERWGVPLDPGGNPMEPVS